MITVLGYDGAELSAEAQARVKGAELVVGGARHLASLPDGTPTRVWSSISEDLQALLALTATASCWPAAIPACSGRYGGCAS